MSETTELVVLGAGTGGYSTALFAANLGMEVTLIEREKVGGTCLHWGCIPTKAMLQAAEVAEHAQHSQDYGINATYESVELSALHEYKNGVVNANWKGLQASLKGRGVETVHGNGRLKDATTVVVDTDEGERTISASQGMVLATGSTPRDVPIEGAETDGEVVINSDHALYLDRVPEAPIVLGAGAIGVEFATVWNAFGADVTIVEMLDNVVPNEDVDTQKMLARLLKRRGMDVRAKTKLVKVERGEGGLRATVENAKGEQSQIEGDTLMVAIGRKPRTEGVGFEDAGVSLDRGYVEVDEYCRPGPDKLYAVGDILPLYTLGLAHSSFQEGKLVAQLAAGRSAPPIDYKGVPRVTYCHPEVASVGWNQQDLDEQGIDYEVHTFPYSHNARAMMMKEGGQVKIIAEADGGRVLGIHIVGPRATDMIAEGQMIYNWEALPMEVGQFIHPHPTLSEAIGEAHLAFGGMALHG